MDNRETEISNWRDLAGNPSTLKPTILMQTGLGICSRCKSGEYFELHKCPNCGLLQCEACIDTEKSIILFLDGYCYECRSLVYNARHYISRQD